MDIRNKISVTFWSAVVGIFTPLERLGKYTDHPLEVLLFLVGAATFIAFKCPILLLLFVVVVLVFSPLLLVKPAPYRFIRSENFYVNPNEGTFEKNYFNDEGNGRDR